jgi:hypothetical protein
VAAAATTAMAPPPPPPPPLRARPPSWWWLGEGGEGTRDDDDGCVYYWAEIGRRACSGRGLVETGGNAGTQGGRSDACEVKPWVREAVKIGNGREDRCVCFKGGTGR